jgi:methylated-DNA-[protein]-cysteine S-methyltransferase
MDIASPSGKPPDPHNVDSIGLSSEKAKAIRGPLIARVKEHMKEIAGFRSIRSPLGWLLLRASAHGITALDFVSRGSALNNVRPPKEVHSHLDAAVEWIEAYFKGAPTPFPWRHLAPGGTTFQQRVWRALWQIHWGQTRSYAEIAARLGSPGAARAVGGACGANPLPLLIPCHRVVAAHGGLGGFSAGLARKRWMLGHENAVCVAK